MAYSDPDPTAIGRKVFLVTLVSAMVFATAAYLLVS
jgi:hypothetical protein